LYFEQFYLGCLSHASYMLGSEGEAVVVDPQRDVELYLKAAADHGLRIAHIVETHLHADFVSGHRELAERTGATIYIGASAQAGFPHVPVRNGDEIAFGNCRLNVLETPGHTAESICLVVRDPERGLQPWAVLTGDTLFIGDVGRPDLSPSQTPYELAGLLYDSLHNKLLKLPNETLVYPAHGAGSLCGRNMRAEKSSTIGQERLTNYALQIKSRSDFVNELTENLPARPAYFAEDAAINRQGASALESLPEPPVLTPREIKAIWDVFVLDTRSAEDYSAAHLPGSVCIPLAGQFASWAGAVIGLRSKIILVAESADKMHEARMRLARVGIENVVGWTPADPAGWRAAHLELRRLPQVDVHELHNSVENQWVEVLDVRRESEFESGHIAGAHLHPLDHFPDTLPRVDHHLPVAVHCKGGYRSIIACGLLMRAGLTNLVNVRGGFDAWKEAGLPTDNEPAYTF